MREDRVVDGRHRDVALGMHPREREVRGMLEEMLAPLTPEERERVLRNLAREVGPERDRYEKVRDA